MPEVRRLTEAAFKRVEEIEDEQEAGRIAAHEARRRTDQVVAEWAGRIMEHGIEVKGLGLVDFDNGSGYYCWKYPEPGLQYYHTYEEGFGGRVRIH